MTRKALGRGLRALIPEPEEAAAPEGGAAALTERNKGRQAPQRDMQETRPEAGDRDVLRYVPTDQIVPNAQQPRTEWEPAGLEGLARSILKNGLLEPIILRERDGSYELVAGERRWRACNILGWKEIPAIVRCADDRESLEVALVENIQRSDLNPVDEARAFQVLSEEHKLTHDEIASRVGKDRSTVTNLLRILQLSEPILKHVSRGTLSAGHARVLLSVPDGYREALAERIVRESWSVRDAESWARRTTTEPGKRPRSRTAGPRKPESIGRLEEQLSRHFSTEIRIRPRRHGGRLEIRYHDDEDFSRILEQLGISVP